MIFGVAAALRVLVRTPDVVDSAATNRDNIFELRSDPLVRRLAITLFATNLFAQAAAVVLVVVWVTDVTNSQRMLGLIGTAFALGLLAAALANARLVHSVPRLFVLGLGVLVGGGTLLVIGGRPAVLLLVVLAAMVAGVATASVIPVIATMLSGHVPALLRSRVDGLLSSVAYLGIPIGTAAAAWFLGQERSVPVALGVAAVALLVALLIPVFAFRTWRQLMPDAPAFHGQAKLPARLTVTLAYTNGQWVVEVRRGRALLGSRHLVRSAEALSMLSILDVPGVRDSVEKALAVDQTEAARQADRMRSELSELEAKLAGLTEMVEITETQRPAPKQREGTDAEVSAS
jgi:MFS family permease